MNLDTYINQPTLCLVGGKTLSVSPLKVRQIPGFTRAISPVMGPLMAGEILTAVAVAGDDLVRAVSIATGEQVEWLGDLDADDFVKLASKVLEVNADFFVHRLTPVISQVSESLSRILGATHSPSSLPEDWPGESAQT
jgi:hypothetical protein